MLRVSRTGDGRYDIDDVLRAHRRRTRRRRSRRASPSTTSSSRGGGADFVDRPLATTHRVRDLELAIPFVSSLPSEREIKVEPHLAFALDGSRFDSAGAATPFAERGNGELRVKLDGFAVAPYLGYLPRGLPAQLRAATLDADVVVAFEQRPKLSLKVSGVGRRERHRSRRRGGQRAAEGRQRQGADRRAAPARAAACASSRSTSMRRMSSPRATPPAASTCCSPPRRPSGTATPVARVPLPTSARAPPRSAAAARSAARRAARARAARAPRRRPRRRGASASPRSRCAPAGSTGPTRRRARRPRSRSPTSRCTPQTIAWPLAAPVVFRGDGTARQRCRTRQARRSRARATRRRRRSR